jgi:hypothetical protein
MSRREEPSVSEAPQLAGRSGLMSRREVRTLELRTGYRVPQAIADYAVRFLAPEVAPTQSYRDGGEMTVRPVDDLDAALRQAVRESPPGATAAVIVADRRLGRVAALFEGSDVSLVPASLVKGLEYDHVIVVEPAEIVAAEPRGYSRLYVVLTRAVASLVVLHQEPLPTPLRD